MSHTFLCHCYQQGASLSYDIGCNITSVYNRHCWSNVWSSKRPLVPFLYIERAENCSYSAATDRSWAIVVTVSVLKSPSFSAELVKRYYSASVHTVYVCCANVNFLAYWLAHVFLKTLTERADTTSELKLLQTLPGNYLTFCCFLFSRLTPDSLNVAIPFLAERGVLFSTSCDLRVCDILSLSFDKVCVSNGLTFVCKLGFCCWTRQWVFCKYFSVFCLGSQCLCYCVSQNGCFNPL